MFYLIFLSYAVFLAYVTLLIWKLLALLSFPIEKAQNCNSLLSETLLSD